MTSLLGEKLGLNDGRAFQVLNQKEQENAGKELRYLVQGVARDAIVPLMNAALSKDEVIKLCCLKGIRGPELEIAPSNNSREAEEESDVDENMALAIRDIQATNVVLTGANRENEQRNENCPADANDPPTTSKEKSFQSPNEVQSQASSSRVERDGVGDAANRVQREAALNMDLMKLSMDLQRQIMDFIREKCD